MAGEKKSPQGQVEDETVAISATVLSAEQLHHEVGSDFNNSYIVLDVRISPKGGKPYLVHLDDFILRSEANGEHTGPFLSAGQIAGSGALVLDRTYGNKANVDSPRVLESTKTTMNDDSRADPAFEALKQKMLPEKTVTEPASGLMFFPMTEKKAKNLILSCKTPQSKLRMSFK